MKNIYIVLFIIPMIIFESCNSDFDINAPYKEDTYILNCILHNDSNIQYAVISKSIYTNNGAIPVSDNTTQNIQGADVKIFYNDSVFVMRDTTILVNETPVNCYYIKNLIVKAGKPVSIEASIPGWKTLKASIITPKMSYGNFINTFPQKTVDPRTVDPSKYQAVQAYNWDSYTVKTKIRTFMSLPEMKVIYRKIEDGKYQAKEILLPLGRGYDREGNFIPVNNIFSFLKCCTITLDAINKSMREISGEDTSKNNYAISKVLFNVTCMEEALSAYYSVNNNFGNDFTVKTRPSEVTNIQGGKGIFGACYVFTRPLLIDRYYIESFGYRVVSN